MEWANRLDDDGPRLTLDEMPALTEVYLVDATDSEADREELIDRYAEEIWDQQLDQWSTDETQWPVNRTPHTLLVVVIASAPSAALELIPNQRLDVVRDLFVGREPHAWLALHVLHQPLEHRDARTVTDHVRMHR